MPERARLVEFGHAIAEVQASAGGEMELSRLLRCTRVTVAAYRNGARMPSRMTCRQLERICAILDGPQTTRTFAYWMAITRPAAVTIPPQTEALEEGDGSQGNEASS